MGLHDSLVLPRQGKPLDGSVEQPGCENHPFAVKVARDQILRRTVAKNQAGNPLGLLNPDHFQRELVFLLPGLFGAEHEFATTELEDQVELADLLTLAHLSGR